MVDFATENYTLQILGSVTTWLGEVDFVVVAIIFALVGILSPPLGAPFTIYPIIVSFVFYIRSGSKVEAIMWGTAMTLVFLPPGGVLGFWLSRHVLKKSAERVAKR